MHNCYVETYFSQENFLGNEPKLAFEAHHAPLSVDISSNVPNYKVGLCFVISDNENELVQKMLDCLKHARMAPTS